MKKLSIIALLACAAFAQAPLPQKNGGTLQQETLDTINYLRTHGGGVSVPGTSGQIQTTDGAGAFGTPLSSGTSAGNVVVLGSGAKLPAVDGSLLTNLPSTGGASLPCLIDNFSPAANGTTDDSAVFTTAQAACAQIILQANKSYKIAANYTFTSSLVFQASSRLVIPTSATVNLNGTVFAPLANLFTFTGTGAATIGPKTTTVYPEWFGAVGDGTTDDAVALQAAINSTSSTVSLQARVYAFTPPLVFTHNGERFIGQGRAQTPSFTGSTLTTTTNTGDMIQITGGGTGNCLSGGVNFVDVGNFNLQRSGVATAGTGIKITKGCGVVVHDVYSYDNFVDVYMTSTANTTIQDFFIYKSTSVVSARKGIQLDGSVGNVANNSINIFRATVTGTGSGISGLYLGPGNVGDVFVDQFETALVDYGINVAPTTCTNSACNEDIRFHKLVLDQTLVAGVFVTGLTQGVSSGPPTLVINDIYFGAAATGAIGVDVEGLSSGVMINGGTIRTAVSSGVGVKLAAGTSDSMVRGVKFDDNPTGVVVASAENIVVDNFFNGTVSAQAITHVDMQANANLNLVTNNVFSGYATNAAVAIAATALNNVVWPNIIDPTHIAASIVSASGAYGNQVNGPGGTVAPGVSVCGTIGSHSTNEAGFITSGTSGACGAVLTFDTSLMGAANVGWTCHIDNQTHPGSTNFMTQVGTSATAVTFSGVTVSGDVLAYSCKAY